MDWKLIYRTPEQMAVLSDNIPGDAWESHRLFWDAHGNIIFLDLVKRGRPARRPGRPRRPWRPTWFATRASSAWAWGWALRKTSAAPRPVRAGAAEPV